MVIGASTPSVAALATAVLAAAASTVSVQALFPSRKYLDPPIRDDGMNQTQLQCIDNQQYRRKRANQSLPNQHRDDELAAVGGGGGGGGEASHLCSPERDSTLFAGRWVHPPRGSARPQCYATCCNGCKCPTPANDTYWVPHSCEVKQWDAESFCAKLEVTNRTIAFIVSGSVQEKTNQHESFGWQVKLE